MPLAQLLHSLLLLHLCNNNMPGQNIYMQSSAQGVKTTTRACKIQARSAKNTKQTRMYIVLLLELPQHLELLLPRPPLLLEVGCNALQLRNLLIVLLQKL